jgi:hypothetical protein
VGEELKSRHRYFHSATGEIEIVPYSISAHLDIPDGFNHIFRIISLD